MLLGAANISGPGSTSALGVGLLAVVILLALLGVIFHWWMVIVIPLIGALAYSHSCWVTTTYDEPGEQAR